MNFRTRTIVKLGALCGAPLLLACSGTGNQSATNSQSATDNPAVSTPSRAAGKTSSGGSADRNQELGTDFRLPANVYDYTLTARNQLALAREALMARCMLKLGFKYDASKDQTLNPTTLHGQLMDFGENGNRRRYGITSVSAAQRFGYHLPSTILLPRSDSPADVRQNVHGLGPETPALMAALRGSQASGGARGGGCLGEADQRLQGATSNPIVAKLRSDSFSRSQVDPAVRAVFNQWSACMRSRGYRISSPIHAGDDVDASGTVTARERAEAVADTTCKQQAKVTEVWLGAETRLQNGSIEQQQQQLSVIQGKQAERLRDVADVLSAK